MDWGVMVWVGWLKVGRDRCGLVERRDCGVLRDRM